MARTSLLSALLLLAVSPVAPAQNIYYVDDAAGLDSPTSPILGIPFKTINYALGFAVGGDTVNVYPGVYREKVLLQTDGVRLEALPHATIEVVEATAGNDAGIVVRASFQDITEATVVRGFTIDGSELDSGLPHGIIADNFGGLGTTHDISPTIEFNEVLDCVYGIVVDVRGQDASSTATLRGNIIKPKNPAVCGSEGGLYGTYLQSADGATMNATVRSHTHLHLEAGIYVTDQGNSTNNAVIQSGVDAYCEWGIYIDGGSNARIVNETVAFSSPASAVPSVHGIESQSPNTEVYNSIVWVPDAPSCDKFQPPIPGLDLVGTFAFIDAVTLIEDVSPTSDPEFLDETSYDFRIGSSSPALDAGVTSLIGPLGSFPIDHDHHGNPRILDPLRTGAAIVDLGALEHTPVDLNAVVAHPLYATPDPIGRMHVDAAAGLPMTATATTIYNNDLCFFLVGVPPANTVFQPYGNLLLSPNLVVTLVPVIANAATFGATLPAAYEFAFHMQAVFVDLTTGTGNLTRLLEIEINQP